MNAHDRLNLVGTNFTKSSGGWSAFLGKKYQSSSKHHAICNHDFSSKMVSSHC